jgi:site-specific recombinase XerD
MNATITSKRKKLPVILEQEEVNTLLKEPSNRYPTGIRNKTILLLMLNCGLRLSEVINLKPGDINLTKNKLRVENGKGGKDRNLGIPDYTASQIEKWRDIRPKSKYFLTTLKGSKLSSRYIQIMVKRYGKRAGIKKNVYPHLLRHTYATEFYRGTRDLEKLRMILGHSNISTTIIYVNLASVEVEDAMKGFKEFGAEKRTININEMLKMFKVLNTLNPDLIKNYKEEYCGK